MTRHEIAFIIRNTFNRIHEGDEEMPLHEALRIVKALQAAKVLPEEKDESNGSN